MVMRECRTSGDETDSTGDQGDAHPAKRADLLVQGKFRDEREQDVSERGRWQDVGQVRPGESVHVRSKKGKQQKDAERHPGIEDREDDTLQMVNRDAASLLHPVRQHGVTGRCKDGHSSQHQILAKGQKQFSIISTQLKPIGCGSED